MTNRSRLFVRSYIASLLPALLRPPGKSSRSLSSYWSCDMSTASTSILAEGTAALWEKLPRLESIVYEPWRVWRRTWKIMCGGELTSAIQANLPSHVRTVSIFEDYNDHLVSALRDNTFHPDFIDTSLMADLMLAKALTSRNCDFEHLSTSYMIDSRQFLNPCQPFYNWYRLQSLTLMSSIKRKQLVERNFLHYGTMLV
ncbi:hypothetical protein BDV12DRAFT_33561 [Aspergillus spectabilis]